MKDSNINNENNNDNKFVLRILLSPLIFLWGIVMLIVFTFFPLSFFIPFSIMGMISAPFIWIFRKSGSEIEHMEPYLQGVFDFFEEDKNVFRDHFLGATIYLWGPFAMTYHYIKTSEIITF